MSSRSPWLIVSQPRIGLIGLLILLTISNLMMPLSMDMYTPAIPEMTLYFNASEAMMNLTLTAYVLVFSVGLLLFGSLSDRFGRRPLLVVGMAVFALANAGCALSTSIWFLVATRTFAALGAGAVSSVSAAIVKDAFVPDRCATVLSLIQIMFVIGPIAAPVLGALMLQIADWRFIFGALAVIGAACTILSLAFNESLEEGSRTDGSIIANLSRMIPIAKNKGFTIYLLSAGLFNLPFMAFIAVASYIYMWDFDVSSMGYGIAFAATSLLAGIGPVITMATSRSVKPRIYMGLLIAIALIAGVLMLLFGRLSVIAFFLTFAAFAITQAAVRPFSMNILLAQYDQDAGAVSSLTNFAFTMIGCAGMPLAVLPWPNFIFGIGVLIVVSLALSALGMFAIRYFHLPLKGINEADALSSPRE